MLALPVLLFAASCVPTARAGTEDAHPASLTARPPAQAIQPVPTATEEPPPPEILAQEIAVGDPAKPFDIGPASKGDVQTALECLTAAIYYEARSQSDDGQRAVAQVVLNRVRHPAFPKTVCGVVYQGSNRSTGCQFTFTCDGSLRRAREPYAWGKARKIAAAALAGYVFAPVGLATHYHTTAIHPWWADSMSKAVTIGAHIFYRWNGAWGDPKSFQRPYVGAEGTAQAWNSWNGTAADPNVQVVSGVTIHHGMEASPASVTGDDGNMVRIHRAGSGARPVVMASAAPAAPPVEGGAGNEAVEGVRIHRAGGDGATADATASALGH
ncbi:MAG TPA: cell wall hydrolase [Allosphingosinicella sp.]|nr:cell wall hydrolase [Allosphingosinicella sp.]